MGVGAEPGAIPWMAPNPAPTVKEGAEMTTMKKPAPIRVQERLHDGSLRFPFLGTTLEVCFGDCHWALMEEQPLMLCPECKRPLSEEVSWTTCSVHWQHTSLMGDLRERVAAPTTWHDSWGVSLGVVSVACHQCGSTRQVRRF